MIFMNRTNTMSHLTTRMKAKRKKKKQQINKLKMIWKNVKIAHNDAKTINILITSNACLHGEIKLPITAIAIQIMIISHSTFTNTFDMLISLCISSHHKLLYYILKFG